MIAVDTNVIVRLITADDPRQLDVALALAARETLYVSHTVLIETEWVLRSRYLYSRAATVNAIGQLRQVFDICFEHEADVRWAIECFAQAGELADYLHIAAARPSGKFATFEHRLAQRAGPDAPVSIETLS